MLSVIAYAYLVSSYSSYVQVTFFGFALEVKVFIIMFVRFSNLPNFKSGIIKSCCTPEWNKTFTYQDMTERDVSTKLFQAICD